MSVYVNQKISQAIGYSTSLVHGLPVLQVTEQLCRSPGTIDAFLQSVKELFTIKVLTSPVVFFVKSLWTPLKQDQILFRFACFRNSLHYRRLHLNTASSNNFFKHFGIPCLNEVRNL